MRCPICNTPVAEPDASSPGRSTFPFCSERCRLIDLGRWLDGKYQVPVVEEEGDEAEFHDPGDPSRGRDLPPPRR